VIIDPLKLPLFMSKFSKTADNFYDIEFKFPADFPEIINKNRNILNNFGVIQFETSDFQRFYRQLMIFTEEPGKTMKIILVAS